ncbi:MAG: hypothetical protein MR414_08155 [Bacteroidales bacterium]|nr:hypothetical protein [Bacteroidales bacterium]MCI5483444.1 hypothetical protein [Bacteroidales bacterium]MDD6751254.1 hypothetical protein [Bacteroidales bacterium]MDY2878839.1 hypothetical protein [Candidatus Cryptobacteroides sp.]
MEREDPLEKFERRESERKANGPLKTVMYVMIVVAVALAAALAYVLVSKNSLVEELNFEKMELAAQLDSLQADYEGLSSEYDTINAQLDSSREEVAQLIERVKKTEATNRAKIRQYEKELGTLRSIMRGYIVQIDSLNTLNHKLTVEAATARREAAEHRRKSEELTAEVETLSGKVATGSVIKARALNVIAYNSNSKSIDRASKVVKLLCNLTLIENDLAPKGPVRVYVRVTAPDGTLLRDGNGDSFELDGKLLEATASREVDYNGNELEVGIYVNNISSFMPGIYTVKAYTVQSALGSTELLLR